MGSGQHPHKGSIVIFAMHGHCCYKWVALCILLINPYDLKHALISAFGKGVGIHQKGYGLRFEAKNRWKIMLNEMSIVIFLIYVS